MVLGIPRGGIIVARELARALGGELDIILARKLRAPVHPELALGSVAEDGKVFLNELVVRGLGVSSTYIEEEKSRQLAELRRRSEMIRQVRPRVPLESRVVVVTDDGVATGATTRAAVWAVRLGRPKRLMAAIPVGSRDTLADLAADVDDMLCLRAPPLFGAVGQYYQQFYPVEDEEVLEILREEQGRSGRRSGPAESQ